MVATDSRRPAKPSCRLRVSDSTRYRKWVLPTTLRRQSGVQQLAKHDSFAVSSDESLTISVAKRKKGKASREVSGLGREHSSEGEKTPRMALGCNRPGKRGAETRRGPKNPERVAVRSSASVEYGRVPWPGNQSTIRRNVSIEGAKNLTKVARLASGEVERKDQERRAGTMTIGRVLRKFDAEDPRDQAPQPRSKGKGQPNRALRPDSCR